MSDRKKDKRSPRVETISPIPFRPAQQNRASSPITSGRRFAWAGFFAALLALVAVTVIIFSSRHVSIQVDVPPAKISIRGGLISPHFGDHYLLRPGTYNVQIEKPCYATLETQLVVSDEKKQNFRMTLRKLPGKISVSAHPKSAPGKKIREARIFIDGKQVGHTPLDGLEVAPGNRQITVQSGRYREHSEVVTVEGCGKLQEYDLALTPGWSDVTLGSVPSGAIVTVDGKDMGKTPIVLELTAGGHDVQLSAEGYKTWRERLVVKAENPQEFKNIQLQPADGLLAIRTSPPGARVMIEKRYIGQSPLEVALAPATPHNIYLSKSGYEEVRRSIQIETGEKETLAITLQAVKGIVHFSVQPAGSRLFINGKSIGKVPQKINLLATVQNIEIRKKGYQPYSTRITPRPGFPQEIRAVLKPLSPEGSTSQALVKARNGYVLKRINSGRFVMGSSRREQGRRSNETLRKIELRRPFYMGLKEITNKEFRMFVAQHDSGFIKSVSLNSDDLPVVQISWDQAALFCNWLSAQESLPPAYVLKNGKLSAAKPMTTGYRLPTEAEWEYCARFTPRGVNLKYPWGEEFPPRSESGNFADVSARILLANTIEGYTDGYPATAPPGIFPASHLGFFDLGGNVSEWCNDYYDIYSYDAEKIVADPSGPEDGSLRVIRGSSWRHAGISSLRLTYRDYSNEKRPDLGFRICRYAE
jgi:formylglycine-generating enzyme required for sulfatase activity